MTSPSGTTAESFVLSIFRLYETEECGADRYPHVWHDLAGDPSKRVGGTGIGVKDLVRHQAGERCIRCQHPYSKGTGEWSPCDERCTHRGPGRYRPGWSEHGETTPSADVDPWSDDTCTPPEATAGDLIDGGIDVEAHWRILTVHHLRLGNDAKRDLRWWNLTALCQRCHLKVQSKVQMERIWPYPHSDWFRPYAAGWYAWSYLGENLTREETMARLPELLALEQTVGAMS